MKGKNTMVKIQTRDFGEIEVDENDIYDFPNGLYAFEDNKLTQITIGKKVKKLYKNAFRNQKKLKVINITAAKLKTVGKYAFKGIDKNAVFKITGGAKDYERVKKLIIKSGVSSTVTFEHIKK